MNNTDLLAARFGLQKNQAADSLEQIRLQRDTLETNMADNAEVETTLQESIDNMIGKEYALTLANGRALQLSYARGMELFNFAAENFKGREWEAFPALVCGSQRALPGSRKSVAASQNELKGYYLGGVISDLAALDDGKHLKVLNRELFDADIANALWSIDNPAAPEYRGPKEALEVARVIRKWQEKARDDANRAGARTDKEPGYVVRQSHDRSKMRRAGEEKWTEDIMPLLDWDRAGGGNLLTEKKRKDFLREVYVKLTVARQGKQGGDELPASGSRIAVQVAGASPERELPFRDGAAWFRYNADYGRGNVREAVVDGLSSMADNTALLRALGPNPHGVIAVAMAMLEAVYRDAGDQNGLGNLAETRRHTDNIMKEVDGTLNAEAAEYPTLAAVGRITRALNSITRLGGTLLSGFSDAPNFAEELADQGYDYLSALTEEMTLVLHGRAGAEQKRILSGMGVFADSMAGDIAARVSGADGPGAMTTMQAWFFKLNGLSWWTDSWRKAVGLMIAHELALDGGTVWSGLSRQRRDLMKMYHISEAEWELMRKGQLTAEDGRMYFTPDALETVSDADISAYLQDKGVNATDIRIADAREELADRLRIMLRDSINRAVLGPDAKTPESPRQGMDAGTPTGETLRWAMQFKRFSTLYSHPVPEYPAKENTENSRTETVTAFARLMLMTIAFGYVSMAAEDLAGGRTPRDPREAQTWLAAFTRGGGAGFYGDFIFGDLSRFDRDSAKTPSRPTATNLDELARLWTRMREGDSARQSLAHWMQNNIPGNSLFYVRSAMDYLIMYNLYEWMKPGYFTRMRKRVEKENNQTFFMRPVEW